MTVDQPQICLIGGTGRSGTTVTADLFATHPDVVKVTELRLLIDPDGLLDLLTLADNWSPAHIDARIRRLRNLMSSVASRTRAGLALSRLEQTKVGRAAPVTLAPKYANRGARDEIPGYDKLCSEFLDELTDFTYPGKWVGMSALETKHQNYASPRTREELAGLVRGFLSKIVAAATAPASATHYLEKNTHNILWFDQILEVMPDAKLVHVVRDPRDSASSMLGENWAPSEADQVITYLTDLHARWDAVAVRVPDDSFIEVRLEDLVDDRKTTLDQVCEFWDLDDWPGGASFDLSRNNAGRWRSDQRLRDPEQIARLDSIADHYGYETS